MSDLEKAARMALEWIEAQPDPRMLGALRAITALRQALEEPAQQCNDCNGMGIQDGKGDKCLLCDGHGEQPAQQEQEPICKLFGTLPVYDRAAQRKPAQQQEPWGACVYGRVFVGRLPEHARKFSEDEGVSIQWLYTSPPAQRTWVGLTDEEIESIFNNWPTYHLDHEEFARVIEDILREKNL